jgi:hypothetical protein
MRRRASKEAAVVSANLKAALVSILILAPSAAMAGVASTGIDSNRAALGLPVSTRISQCAAPVNGSIDPCGADAPAGLRPDILLLSLASLATLGIGIGVNVDQHGGHGSSPVSP